MQYEKRGNKRIAFSLEKAKKSTFFLEQCISLKKETLLKKKKSNLTRKKGKQMSAFQG